MARFARSLTTTSANAGMRQEGALQETWLDADQTAQSLHITKATLYKLVRRGRVPATKIHGKWRFTREAIVELFAASNEPPPTDPMSLLPSNDPERA